MQSGSLFFIGIEINQLFIFFCRHHLHGSFHLHLRLRDSFRYYWHCSWSGMTPLKMSSYLSKAGTKKLHLTDG